MAEKHLSKRIAAVLVIVLVFLGVGLLQILHLLDTLEYKSYDFRAKLFANSYKPSDEIAVVLLDQDSIDWANAERGWGWPWPREAYAEFVDFMNQGNAKSVAFDVLFSEPSIYRSASQDAIIDNAVEKMEQLRLMAQESSAGAAQTPRSGGRERPQPSEEQRSVFSSYMEAMQALRGLTVNQDDEAFANAEQRYGRVVQTVFFSTQTGISEVWQSNADKKLFAPGGFDNVRDRFDLSAEGRIGAQFPIPRLLDAAGALGNVTNAEDPDGINRRAKLFINFDGRAVPGLSAASLLVSGSSGTISYNANKKEIEWEGRRIPVDDKGRSILRFRGSLNRYLPYSASEILESAQAIAQGGEPLYLPRDFTGKYVFFGFYAPGLFDICSNPLESVYPGMGIHITMLDNMLSNDFIREVPQWIVFVLLFAVIAAITALALFSEKLPFAVGTSLVITALIVGLSLFAYHIGYWLPLVLPLAGIFAAFITCYIYNYATEGSQKRYIKSAFSQYLSPIYIEKLIGDTSLLKLGGERLDISIFFSDVQGFTTISENLDPDQLKELLNDYLSVLTDIIQDSGGTIDKYEGDAIIAFWNAPIHLADHAKRALGAAIECQRKLTEMGPWFEEKFNAWNIDAPGINKRLLTRIGLNTGYAVVGNFGSEHHFNYTMLGDSVNLAARLEGLNKQFGTYLMCTENTFAEAGKNGGFFGRKLAQVAVVGKNEPVTVWEPMTEQLYREKEAVIKQFDEAREIFYQGKFAGALTLFEALADKDSPPAYYAAQCRYYLENPDEWKGHWKALSK
ncbi:MAG: CHASE2 domain-containing protein [Treponema sp.]|jgi:adenylate cyclase|nr:CHASE2 domain-containing protein [Treponema sp.]